MLLLARLCCSHPRTPPSEGCSPTASSASVLLPSQACSCHISVLLPSTGSRQCWPLSKLDCCSSGKKTRSRPGSGHRRMTSAGMRWQQTVLRGEPGGLALLPLLHSRDSSWVSFKSLLQHEAGTIQRLLFPAAQQQENANVCESQISCCNMAIASYGTAQL